MTTAKHILVPRPLPQAQETADRIRRLSLGEPLVAPLLHVVPIERDVSVFGSAFYDGIIVTSANALPALQHFSRSSKIYTVGDRLAERVRGLGFTHVQSAHGTSHELKFLLQHNHQLVSKSPHFIHLSGEKVSDPTLYHANDWHGKIDRQEVYRIDAASQWPAAAKDFEHVLLYSVQMAEAFQRLCPFDPSQLTLYCLSKRIADCLLPHWRMANLKTAASPNEDSLFSLL